MDKSLSGRVATIIGGSSAIGSAICRHFANAGATCIVTYYSGEKAARDLVAKLLGKGRSVAHVPVDDSAALNALAAEVQAKHGRVDALDDQLIDDIFCVNWRGPFAAVRAFRILLAAGGDGLVINISSIAGVTAMGSDVAYCASKAALDSMTKSLARALAPEIRVVSVSPGLVDTDFVKGLDKKWRDEQAARTPLKRLAAANEIGAAALAVVAHLHYSTGRIIAIDGGRPLA